jgi:thymidine kinase
MGKVWLIIGPMWSGKSSKLLSLTRKFDAIGRNVLLINHKSDNRYGSGCVTTHDGDRLLCHVAETLQEVKGTSEYIQSDVVLINEGQFFADLVDFVQDGSDTTEKTFVVCGLAGGFMRQPLGDILDLIPLAEKVEKISGLCMRCRDGTPGDFTRRKGWDGRDIDPNVVIGGKELYECVCRKHWLNADG